MERYFGKVWKSVLIALNSHNIPATVGNVLIHRNVRNSKYDPLVDKIDLPEADPQYAHAKLVEGYETFVSIK